MRVETPACEECFAVPWKRARVYWSQITVDAPLEASEAVVDVMADCGMESLQELARADGRVRWRGHLVWDMESEKAAQRVRGRLKMLGRVGLPERGYRVRHRQIWFEEPQPGWVLDEPLPVLFVDHIGERVVIKDVAHVYDPAPGEAVFSLVPSRAFGNGAHMTTRLCCRALERYLRRGDRVIEVGTGTGLLALASAALGASWVLGVDSEPEAVAAAAENVAANGMQDVVDIRFGKGFAELDCGPVDVIIANILPFAIEAITPDAMRFLRVGGTYILSGIRPDQVKELDYAIMHFGLEIEDVGLEEDWCCLVYRRTQETP